MLLNIMIIGLVEVAMLLNIMIIGLVEVIMDWYYLEIFITTTKYTTEKCSNIKIMLHFRKVNMDLERKTQLTKV